jgi:CBS domain containing-hemolysin-like protein
MHAKGTPGADRLMTILEDPERYLNSLLLVVLALQTVQSILVGVIAGRLFGGLGVAIAAVVNIVVVFVIAEAAPKTWALQHPERAAIRSAPVIVAIGAIAPVRWLAGGLIKLTNVILPGKGLRSGPWVSEAQIIALADVAVEASVIEDNERDLIESIIDFGDTIAREIMVPRTDMVAFEDVYPVAACVEIAILNGLSRFPVYRDNVDDIVGIVYAKDLMRAERDQRHDEPISTLMRPAHFVPETKRVAELLREMQSRTTHIAIVVDEYGGTAGLVTMEDLLEELVGDISDEFDEETNDVEQVSENMLVVHDASINVDDLNDDYSLELPTGDWDSLGGLVFSELGRVPEVGDVVEVDGYALHVESMEARRVGRVRIVAEESAREKDSVSTDE